MIKEYHYRFGEGLGSFNHMNPSTPEQAKRLAEILEGVRPMVIMDKDKKVKYVAVGIIYRKE